MLIPYSITLWAFILITGMLVKNNSALIGGDESRDIHTYQGMWILRQLHHSAQEENLIKALEKVTLRSSFLNNQCHTSVKYHNECPSDTKISPCGQVHITNYKIKQALPNLF